MLKPPPPPLPVMVNLHSMLMVLCVLCVGDLMIGNELLPVARSLGSNKYQV